MAKFFLRLPDTPAQIWDKINALTEEIEILTRTLLKNKKDLLVNHLNYSDHIIAAKKQMLEETTRAIRLKELKVKNLKLKLK